MMMDLVAMVAWIEINKMIVVRIIPWYWWPLKAQISRWKCFVIRDTVRVHTILSREDWSVILSKLIRCQPVVTTANIVESFFSDPKSRQFVSDYVSSPRSP